MGRVRLGPGAHVSGTYRLAITVLRRPMLMLTKRDWRGGENLRVNGSLDAGIVVAANHVSHADPLVLAHFLYDNGRLPRFLAKESVFRVPFVGWVVRGAGQIPVHRGTADAANALRSAVQAARDGECVTIYPEGTVTREPQLWPMTGKTGAVRIALEADVPLIPVAQWGPQEVRRPYVNELHLLPRKTMHVWAGPPVALDDYRGRELTEEELDEATERLMAAITSLLEQIRGEQAPSKRFVWKGQATGVDASASASTTKPAHDLPKRGVAQ